jgi:hypothetical protein
MVCVRASEQQGNRQEYVVIQIRNVRLTDRGVET